LGFGRFGREDQPDIYKHCGFAERGLATFPQYPASSYSLTQAERLITPFGQEVASRDEKI
jgi:hypothetical protein